MSCQLIELAKFQTTRVALKSPICCVDDLMLLKIHFTGAYFVTKSTLELTSASVMRNCLLGLHISYIWHSTFYNWTGVG